MWKFFRKKRATEAEARKQAVSGEDEAELRAHYGGTYHPCLIALTIFSSAFSGYTVVGVPQTTLERGYMVLMFFAGTCAQCIGMLWFFPRLRRVGMDRGYMSPGDFVADRFRHRGITVLCVIASSLPQFIYLAVQLASFGEALNGLTRGLIPKNIGILCCICVMLTMEILGGMHSVVLTDIVQAIIMLFGFAMLAIVMITKYGVLDLGVGCENGKTLLDPHTYTNCFTGQLWDVGADVQYGCLWNVDRLTLTPDGLPISWPFQTPLRDVKGAAAAGSDAEQGFNAFLVIVLSSAALAAIMPSADSVILGASNSVCVDIHKNMVNRTASTPCIVFMGQVISVVMCFVCYFFAMQISGSTFLNWLSVQNGVLFQVGPAMYFGLHKDFSDKSIFRGILAGFGLALAIDIVTQFYQVPCRLYYIGVGEGGGSNSGSGSTMRGMASGGASGGDSNHPSFDECSELKWFAEQCYFYICGFAMLTLLLNGTTTGHPLNYLGLMTTEANAVVLKKHAKLNMKRELRMEFDDKVPFLYVKAFTEKMARDVEDQCAMLQGAQHERDTKGAITKATESTAAGHKRRSMVGRIKTGATAGTQVAGKGVLNFGAGPAGNESVAGGVLPSDMTQSFYEDEEDFISFEEDFWTTGRSQERAISLLYMRILRAEYQHLSDIHLMPESAGTTLLESIDTCIELVKNNAAGPSTMNAFKFGVAMSRQLSRRSS